MPNRRMNFQPRSTAGADAPQGATSKWRILIFMDVEQRAQLEGAKAQFAEIVLANLDPGVDVRLCVHGYQLEPPHPLASSVYTITHTGVTRPVTDTRYEPTNGSTLGGFVDSQLKELEELRDGMHAAFVYWGHGRGVGLGIEAPDWRPVPRLPVRPVPVAGARPRRHPHVFAARAAAAHAGTEARLVDNPFLKPRDIKSDGEPFAIGVKDVTAFRHPLELLVLDSCHMGTLETAVEASGWARYLVASQTVNEMSGLNLTSLLQQAHLAADGRALGSQVLAQAGQLYAGAKTLVLFDLTDPTRIATFIKMLRNFTQESSKALLDRAEAGMLVPLLRDTPSFAVRQFLDLQHLCNRIPQLTASQSLRAAAEALSLCLRPGTGGFVAALQGEDDGYAYGPSIYCPWFRASAAQLAQGMRNIVVDPEAYIQLELPRESGWGNLMLALDYAWHVAREEVSAYHQPVPESRAPGLSGPDPKNGGQAAVAPDGDRRNLYVY